MNKSEPKIRVLFVAPKRCRLIRWLMTTKETRLCLYEITRTHHREFFRAPAFLLLGYRVASPLRSAEAAVSTLPRKGRTPLLCSGHVGVGRKRGEGHGREAKGGRGARKGEASAVELVVLLQRFPKDDTRPVANQWQTSGKLSGKLSGKPSGKPQCCGRTHLRSCTFL